VEIAERQINIRVANNPTVLVRIIQAVKRRQINIQKLVAEDVSACDARISINFMASEEKTRLLKMQIDKMIDVVGVN
jgi:acetolactate synthase regulatory subunit